MAASASVKWGPPVHEVVKNSAGAPQPGAVMSIHSAPSASTRKGGWQQDEPRSFDVQGESCTWGLLRVPEQKAGSTEAADRGRQCVAGWASLGKHAPDGGFSCCLR